MKTASNATEKHHGLLTNSVINYELLVWSEYWITVYSYVEDM